MTLLFVTDLSRLAKAPEDKKRIYAAVHSGTISQNVYLYCASVGLGTVVHDLSRHKELGRIMRLKPQQEIMLAQTVGYAAPER